MYEVAQSVFRKPPLRLNCAQAVAHAWQVRLGGGSRLNEDLQDCGGGGAPGGLCGALHAAHRLTGEAGVREEMTRRFAGVAGSPQCREIRRLGILPCEECVGLAAELLDPVERLKE